MVLIHTHTVHHINILMNKQLHIRSSNHEGNENTCEDHPQKINNRVSKVPVHAIQLLPIEEGSYRSIVTSPVSTITTDSTSIASYTKRIQLNDRLFKTYDPLFLTQ